MGIQLSVILLVMVSYKIMQKRYVAAAVPSARGTTAGVLKYCVIHASVKLHQEHDSGSMPKVLDH